MYKCKEIGVEYDVQMKSDIIAPVRWYTRGRYGHSRPISHVTFSAGDIVIQLKDMSICYCKHAYSACWLVLTQHDG